VPASAYDEGMKIAKPMLLVSTPIGVALGLFEGYRLAGGLVVLMAAMIAVIGVAAGSVVMTVRREQLADSRRKVV
jgi:hypothetical protein